MFKFCLLHFFTFFSNIYHALIFVMVKLKKKYFLNNNKIILHCNPSVIILGAKFVPIINTRTSQQKY